MNGEDFLLLPMKDGQSKINHSLVDDHRLPALMVIEDLPQHFLGQMEKSIQNLHFL